MSRTVGPYEDVATARVEGAYELCEGVDETGRPVQILTLGSTSSKDPARRGLLSDTVAWAYATAGPEDAPILVADLEAEQPYVVVLRDSRLRGADRIMDRLLSLGPATGPLPVGPAAAHRPQAPASPAGPPSAPPMSPPVVVIAPPKRRSQARPILIGIASVVGIVALLVGGWIIWTTLVPGDDGADRSLPESQTTAPAAAEEAPAGAAEEGQDERTRPEWRSDAPAVSVVGELFTEEDDTRVVSLTGWPFAFRVPDDYECEQGEQSAVCGPPEGESSVKIGWTVCEGLCDEEARKTLQEQLPYQPMQSFENGDVGFSQRDPYGEWKASMSVFVEYEDTVLHVTAVADVDSELAGEAQPILNDVLGQAKSLEE